MRMTANAPQLRLVSTFNVKILAKMLVVSVLNAKQSTMVPFAHVLMGMLVTP